MRKRATPTSTPPANTAMLPSHRDSAEIPLVAMGSDGTVSTSAAAGRSHKPYSSSLLCGPDCNITDLTIEVPGSTRRSTEDEPPPPRWRTPEFIFYGVVFALVVPLIIYWPMKLSYTSNPNYWTYAPRLSQGWMFGRKVDNSDPQYRSFRSNLGALLGLSIAFLVPSHLVRLAGFNGPAARARFIAGFAFIMLLILHGVGAFKVTALLAANYAAAMAHKPPALARFWPLLVVVLNMGILFANEKCDGYKFGALSSSLAWLDGKAYNGLYPRWNISFNITMLRMVSFALDAHWRSPPPTTPPTDHRGRTASSLPDSAYSFLNYFAYCVYPPLYIAGPIMTFNDFVWQLNHPVRVTARERISYAFRFLFCFLTMEFILHYMYVIAIKDAKAWIGMGPADLSMLGFWNLVTVWLKLLIPWRFFRMWALLDGVDPPENMVRCVANNYSTLGFWRSWHRSYNLWVVRYIYIPLGGSKRVIIATVMVFTFVALWHDLSFQLLAWGWLVSLFIVPELTGRALVPAAKYGHNWWYRHVAAAGGVVNVLLMMSANLVGFVLGLDGMRHLVHELVSTAHGWAFTAFSSACLFIGVQIMFEYREEEARKGINRRC